MLGKFLKPWWNPESLKNGLIIIAPRQTNYEVVWCREHRDAFEYVLLTTAEPNLKETGRRGSLPDNGK